MVLYSTASTGTTSLYSLKPSRVGFFGNIYLVAPGLCTRDLLPFLWHTGFFQLWHVSSQLLNVGSSFLTSDQTWAPCFGSVEFKPLDHHQGSPLSTFVF